MRASIKIPAGFGIAGLLVFMPLAYSHSIKIMDDTESTQPLPGKAETPIPTVARPEATDYAAVEAEMESPIESILEVQQVARTIGKSVGRTVGSYVREKKEQFKRQALLAKFDQSLTDLTAPLQLNSQEYRQFVSGIETLYIEDAVSGKNELDQVHFHELPRLVKIVYAEICLARTQTGTVDLYNLDGSLKARWNLKEGRPDGPVVTYYKDGEIRYIDIYEQGKRLNRKKYDAEGRLLFNQDYDYEISKTEKAQAPAETVSNENRVAPL